MPILDVITVVKEVGYSDRPELRNMPTTGVKGKVKITQHEWTE
jgi:hypothetical protein